MAEFPSSSWKDYELLDSGEVALRDKFDKALPLSIVVRMTR